MVRQSDNGNRIHDRNLPPAPQALSQTTGQRSPHAPEAHPEYLEADEVNAIIRAAPNPKAKLLMREQWRAGRRVSEALDIKVRDLSLDTVTPRCECVPKAHGGIHSRTQRTTGRAARAEEKEKALAAAGVAIVPGPGEIGSTFKQVIDA